MHSKWKWMLWDVLSYFLGFMGWMYLKVSDLEIAKRPVAFNHFRVRLPQRWSLSWDTFTKLQWMKVKLVPQKKVTLHCCVTCPSSNYWSSDFPKTAQDVLCHIPWCVELCWRWQRYSSWQHGCASVGIYNETAPVGVQTAFFGRPKKWWLKNVHKLNILKDCT